MLIDLDLINSDSFINLPLEAQALYFHICAHANEDGTFNNPEAICRMIGCERAVFSRLLMENIFVESDEGAGWEINRYE